MEKLSKDLSMQLDAIVDQNGSDEANLIPMLLAAQELNDENYISEEVGSYIASKLGLRS